MRIAHVITRLIVGGAQENTVSSVIGLNKKKDITIRLYSGPTNGPEGSLESDFESFSAPLETRASLFVLDRVHCVADYNSSRMAETNI